MGVTLMAAGFRPRLGIGLESLVLGQQPSPYGMAGLASEVPPTQQQPKKPGLGKHIAGSLGDFLLQQAGMNPIYTPMMQERRQQDAAEAQWSRRRQAEREDKQWEWQNKPQEQRAPYRFQDNAGNLVEIGPDGRPRTLFTDPTPKINYQRVNNPDGTFTMVPIPMGAAGPPAAPVGKLTPIEGGPGGSPSGAGFPFR